MRRARPRRQSNRSPQSKPRFSFTTAQRRPEAHYAHAGKPPCPWLRMSKLTSLAAFKGWISENITAAEDPEVARLCAAVFAIEPESTSDIAAILEFVRLYRRHFLDASSTTPPSTAWRSAATQRSGLCRSEVTPSSITEAQR